MSEEKSYLENMRESLRAELAARERTTPFQQMTYDILEKFGDIIIDAYETGIKEESLKESVISVATGLGAAAALAIQLVETESGSKEPVITLFENLLLAYMDTVREEEEDATTTEPVGDADNPNTVLSPGDDDS
jgi:hypothetical protein